MDLLTRDELKTLLLDLPGPCVSLFMPAHRGGAEQDPIRFRKLLTEAEKRLTAGGQRSPEARELLQPARELLDEPLFWHNQSDGLALFLAPGFLRYYRLALAFEEQLLVEKRFVVRPLLPLVTGDGRFFVLALSQKGIRLLQGTRFQIRELDVAGVPASLAEVLGPADRDEMRTFHAHPTGGRGNWGAIFHGVGFVDHKTDLLRYFQRIDRGLHELLHKERVPLVVATVEYLLPLYRQANTYPHLLEQGIEGNPDRLSNQELHTKAWSLVEPGYRKTLEGAAGLYRRLVGTGKTSCELREVVPAACEGRIETLFVPAQAPKWGRYDPASGVIEHAQPELGDEDLHNLAAVHVLRHGGAVYAVTPDELPGGTGLAAIYWLPQHRGLKSERED